MPLSSRRNRRVSTAAVIGFGCYKVIGDSMLPSYKANDFVLTFRWPKNKYHCGDVIVVKHNFFGVISKRVERIHASGLITLVGDNLAFSTDSKCLGMINLEQVLGRVIYHLPAPS